MQWKWPIKCLIDWIDGKKSDEQLSDRLIDWLIEFAIEKVTVKVIFFLVNPESEPPCTSALRCVDIRIYCRTPASDPQILVKFYSSQSLSPWSYTENQSKNQPINQSINQANKRTTNQSINQSISEWINQSTDKSTMLCLIKQPSQSSNQSKTLISTYVRTSKMITARLFSE